MIGYSVSQQRVTSEFRGRRSTGQPKRPRWRRNPRFNWQRVAAVLLCGAYFGLFVGTYKFAVAPVYAYSGLVDRPLPLWCWLVLVLLVAAPVLFMDLEFRRASAIAAWLLYLFLIVPCCVVPELTTDGSPVESLWVTVSIVGSFIIFEMMRARPLFRIPKLPEFEFNVIALVPVLVLIFSVVVLSWNGYSFDLQLGEAMNDRRLAAREIVQAESFQAYAVSTLVGAGLPFVVAMAIVRRSLYIAFIALFSIAVVVSFDGTRSTLLFPLLCALSIWVVTRRRGAWLHLLGGFASLPVASVLSGSISMLSLMVVRMQCVPARLTAIYYGFAAESPPLLLRDVALYSWIGGDNPLGQGLPRYIGTTFLHNASQNANANMWAHGQVELRILGPILVSLIAGAILRLLDSIVALKGTRLAWLLAAGLCTYWALVWGNGALQTSLFSNGVIVGLLLISMLPVSNRPFAARPIPSKR
jgi:hypothetical protein